MSIKLINLVWESKATRRPHLTPSEKNVLTQIANNADDTGLAVSLKVEAIERRTNLDERTIQKAFRVLQERGFVTIHQRTGRVSHYQLHIDRFMTTPGHTPGVVNGAPREARSDEKSTRETVAPPPASAARPSVAQTKREEVDASDPRSRATSTPGHTPGVSCGEVCGEDIHTPGVRPPFFSSSPIYISVSSSWGAGRFKKFRRGKAKGWRSQPRAATCRSAREDPSAGYPGMTQLLVIGIDPGTVTGFAMWDARAQRLLAVESWKLHIAMRLVEQADHPFVIFEDARQRKIFSKMDQEQQRYGAAVREGVGSVKRDCSIWEEFLTDLQVPFKARPPIATKWSSRQFEMVTKWKGRTNEHARDAGMIVYGLNVPQVETMIKDCKVRGGKR